MKMIENIEGIDLNRVSFYFDNNNNDCVSLYIDDKNKNYTINSTNKGKYIKVKGKRYYFDNLNLLRG